MAPLESIQHLEDLKKEGVKKKYASEENLKFIDDLFKRIEVYKKEVDAVFTVTLSSDHGDDDDKDDNDDRTFKGKISLEKIRKLKSEGESLGVSLDHSFLIIEIEKEASKWITKAEDMMDDTQPPKFSHEEIKEFSEEIEED